MKNELSLVELTACQCENGQTRTANDAYFLPWIHFAFSFSCLVVSSNMVLEILTNPSNKKQSNILV